MYARMVGSPFIVLEKVANTGELQWAKGQVRDVGHLHPNTSLDTTVHTGGDDTTHSVDRRERLGMFFWRSSSDSGVLRLEQEMRITGQTVALDSGQLVSAGVMDELLVR